MVTAPAQTPIAPELAGLDEYVQTTMAEWRVPGLAIAVVKGGEVIHRQGYGLRDVEQNLPVTPDTLFAIGSCTKAFTTMAIGMLVDDGKLDWDAPVRDYLPAFALHDPIATELMTPRDLVTHRSGLPRHDFSWHKATVSREELFARLRHLQPNKTFRQAMQYQNLMYMSAGYLSGKVAGVEWEELIRERILAPLGMRRSNLSVQESQQDADFAQPYEDHGGEIGPVPFADISAVGPAGSINSSANEMCNWLLLHLAKGRHGETRLISEAQIDQMHAPHVTMPVPSKHPELPYTSYALGWVVQPYRGHPMLWHTGGIDGFLSQVVLLPSQNAGIVILTNLGEGALMTVLSLHLCDRLLGLDHLDWNARLRKDYDEAKAAQETAKTQAAGDRVPNTAPSHPLEDYTGEFAHPGYGSLSVTLEDGSLVAAHNQKIFPLSHYHYDTFEAELPRSGVRFAALFATNTQGEIESVALPFEPSVPPILFTRQPDPRLRERHLLEPLTGEYEVMGETLSVTLKGDDTLLATMPGQPIFELEPVKGTRFKVKGLPGFNVQFKPGVNGAVEEIVLIQPMGAVTGKRK